MIQNDTKFIINTKLSDFYTKIKNSVKKLFKRTPKKEKTTAEIKPEVKEKIETKPEQEKTIEKEEIKPSNSNALKNLTNIILIWRAW